MKIRVLLSICCLLLLAPLFKVQGEQVDPTDLQMLKDYFSSQEERLGGDHKEELKDFVVTPDNPRVSELTDYTLEFTVSKKAYPKILDGYLVFFFPYGFNLADLHAAGIQTNTYSEGFFTNVSVDGQFAILNYSVSYTDSAYKPLPERIKFNVILRSVKNHSQAGFYKIAGAAVKDHKFVAGPSWSEKFEITEAPEFSLFRISSTEVIAPNAPRVNTGQNFQIQTTVHNRISNLQYGVRVNLLSDGASLFEAFKEIDVINPMDSVVVHFDVTASSVSNDSENFKVTIDLPQPGGDVDLVDNEATAIIQTPALLEIMSNIEDSSTINLGSNQTLDMTFELLNHGQAGVSSGHYTLTVIGTEINGDTVVDTGEIVVGTPVEFEYESTNSGRVVVVNFNVDGVPIDANTGEPAPFIDSEFDFVIIEGPVQPSNSDDSFIVEVNPYDPDDGPERFRYNLPNDMHIDFKIFTLIGEEVYTKRYIAGANGGKAGQNDIQWDGRNDKGLVVLNGAYIAMIISPFSDFKASLKLAVLK